ncbi:hypothetical protein [Rhodovulum sp. MB263]|uniref:hypothetical protein n=1 Tax=unclassified Rhodovulum TaxID=2631432 RepID=UPI0018C87C5B|nr:hypothetical protein [Rhodovulum sp. MB263]
MQAIHPILFNRVMRLPSSLRREVLEYAGSASLADDQIRSLLDDICNVIENEHLARPRISPLGRLRAG